MDTFTQEPDSLADRLTAACGAGELAAAAAIDAEEGDEFLHGLLADQMAGAHLLTMRMTALADRAIGAAAGSTGQSNANLPLFDLAAARFAGAAARLNGRYCRGLQTLHALAGPAAEEDDDIQWVGIATEPDTLSPRERTRRINRMKFFRRLHAKPQPNREPARARRRVDAAERALLAAAESAADSLLTETGLDALAGGSEAQHTELFTHQLAASHRLTMRLTGRADVVVTASADPLDRPEGLRLAHGAARLMERFRQGVAMLNRLRTAPDRPRRWGYYSTDQLSEYEREQERAEDIAHGLDPDTGLPALETAPAKATVSAPAPASILLRRGRLNNGNPGGDLLAAPRCGAKARAGHCCRQPAMANGRCRFHGGKSTGPRTAEGLARARRARRVHGLRSAEVIALSAAAAAAHRRLGMLLAAVRTPNPAKDAPVPAGHGVDRSESRSAAGSASVLPFVASASRVSPPRWCRQRGRRPPQPGRSGILRVRS